MKTKKSKQAESTKSIYKNGLWLVISKNTFPLTVDVTQQGKTLKSIAVPKTTSATRRVDLNYYVDVSHQTTVRVKGKIPAGSYNVQYEMLSNGKNAWSYTKQGSVSSARAFTQTKTVDTPRKAAGYIRVFVNGRVNPPYLIAMNSYELPLMVTAFVHQGYQNQNGDPMALWSDFVLDPGVEYNMTRVAGQLNWLLIKAEIV